ncbi:MAG TPA: RsmD family RNA methyltransferase [Burkholderiaceae bacterium]|jgi:16S rRNA (guanine(966)-N(2))-methyltransferase RsmD|nr:RsmD family RNA methyltransferase [Burkholderiaceae bacterium]
MPKRKTKRAATTAAAGARSLSTRGTAPGRIRIVGGVWKRTPIAVAAHAALRPTPDRVRETLFNWLAHLRPDTASLRALDLFAGTGALGFEIASRGARHVLLVERDPQLVANLRTLKERLGAQQVEIRAGDAFAVAATLAPASFDLVFLDPPFGAGLLAPALAVVRPLLAPGGLIYAEADAPLAEDALRPLALRVVRSQRAGRVCFHLLAPE